MRQLIITSVTIILVGCHSPEPLPDGIHLITDYSPDVVIVLDKDRAVIIKQSGNDPRRMIVGNLDGILSATQLESGGSTPRSLELKSEREAEITVSNYVGEPTRYIFDKDGDGVPDQKIEDAKMFDLDKITWKERKQKND